MTTFRRLLFIFSYAVWQGGFLFYTAAVVPIGTDVLGSAREQGFITRLVTNRINECGAIALAVWLPILVWETRRTRWRRRIGLFFWGILVACQAVMFGLHPRLDGLLDPSQHAVLDPERFYSLHRVYLWTISFQWAMALALLAIVVSQWNFPSERRNDASVQPQTP